MKLLNAYLLFAAVCFLSSCRSLAYFESPNNLRNIEGTLHLTDGKSVSGKLVIQTDNLLGSPVKLYTEGDKKPMQFRLGSIKAYTVRNETYVLKEIHEGISFGQQLFFMRRLTPENSRMHLFEHMQRHTVNKTAARYEPEFYVQLPGEEHDFVYATTGNRFVPHFEEKMSRIVGDCAPLAQKIREKQNGYFYAQVNLVKEKRAEVLLRIINEYTLCGHK